VLTLPKGAAVLRPVRVGDPETELLAAVSSEGRLLVFPVADLPSLVRGKGNKIIGIPPARVVNREEYVISVAVVPARGRLVVHSGKRYLVLKPADLNHYRGERGRRGNKLPRGFQRVDRLEVDVGKTPPGEPGE